MKLAVLFLALAIAILLHAANDAAFAWYSLGALFLLAVTSYVDLLTRDRSALPRAEVRRG